ncbi:NUDIX hydrolase [Patescibacteria group bacterium]|nr:NUDIX hydrolase [Patescibacteria group bacterium]
MHILQQKIIASLIKQPGLRFNKLRPEGVESNQFVYHLKVLMRDKLIKQTGNLYQLTVGGKQLADKLSYKDFRPRVQPKIVTMLVCKNSKGEYLWQKRTKEPFHGLVSFPYGKLHLGETIQEAATRELQEKTNMAGKLQHTGDAYWLVYENDELIIHVLCHLFRVNNPKLTKGLIIPPDCFWLALDKIDKTSLVPGIFELVKLKQPHLDQIVSVNIAK